MPVSDAGRRVAERVEGEDERDGSRRQRAVCVICDMLKPGMVCMPSPALLPTRPRAPIPSPPVEEYAEGLAFKTYLNEGRLITQGEVELAEVEECEPKGGVGGRG